MISIQLNCVKHRNNCIMSKRALSAASDIGHVHCVYTVVRMLQIFPCCFKTEHMMLRCHRQRTILLSKITFLAFVQKNVSLLLTKVW